MYQHQSDELTFQAIAQESSEERTIFYQRTYQHLGVAVLAFILLETVLLQIDPLVEMMLSLISGWSWLLLLGGFWFVTNYAEKMALGTMDRSRQYLAFGIYILAEALLFVPLLYLAIYLTEDFSLISQAGLVTLALFGGLTAVALTMEADFNFLKAGLTIGFFLAIGLIVAGMLFGFSLGLWFSVGMVVLAAGSILYQTSNIRYRYQKEQYVAASLGLFASLMLLFWYILDIFMRSE